MMIKQSLSLFLKGPFKYRFSIEQNAKDIMRLGSNIRQHEKNIKDQYLNSEFSKMSPQEIRLAIDKEYDDLKEKLTQPDGILSKIKKGLLNEKQQASTPDSKEKSPLQREAEEYYQSLSHEEILAKSKILKQNLNTHGDDSINEPLSVSTQFGNYSTFQKSFATVRDQKIQFDLLGQDAYSGRNIEQFIKNLDTNYAERKKLDSGYVELRKQNLGQTRQELERMSIEKFDERARLREQEFMTTLEKQFIAEKKDEEEQDDAEEIDVLQRLSPQARQDIFNLYLSGWSVRDISNRYGIFPNRAKAVIYLSSIFYYEVLPRVDMTHIRMMEEWELGLKDIGLFKYVDYGIDMDQLIEREQGVIIPSFAKFRDVDVGATDASQDPAILKKLEQKLQRKKEFNTVGIVGKGCQSYFLKELKINYGRGKDSVSKMFKKILQNYNQPHRLPLPVVRKLEKGPRRASKGFNGL